MLAFQCFDEDLYQIHLCKVWVWLRKAPSVAHVPGSVRSRHISALSGSCFARSGLSDDSVHFNDLYGSCIGRKHRRLVSESRLSFISVFMETSAWGTFWNMDAIKAIPCSTTATVLTVESLTTKQPISVVAYRSTFSVPTSALLMTLSLPHEDSKTYGSFWCRSSR